MQSVISKTIFLAISIASCSVSLSRAYDVVDKELAVDSSRVYDLDEVTIVRQTKEQFLLRRQAVSSTMLSASDLGIYHSTDLRQASTSVPNFVMPNYGSRYTSSMYVRGIGSRVNSPAVGIYVDGVPMASKSAFNTFFHDVNRIDVLRGPQGTLYGLNTEGGLVRIYTKNPITDPGIEWGRTFGSYGLLSTNVSLRKHLSSSLGLSLSGYYNYDKGFLRNHVLDTRADKSQDAGGRLKLIYTPAQDKFINLIADYHYTIQNAFPYGEIADNGNTSAPESGIQGRYRRNSLTTALELGTTIDNLKLSSTTSFQHLHDFMAMDVDYMSADYMAMNQRQTQNAITQELVLAGNTNNRWRHTSGIFGSAQWLHTDAPVFFNQSMDQFLADNIQRPMYNAILSSMSARFLNQGMSAEAAKMAAQNVIERAGGIKVDADMNTVPGIFDTPTFNLGIFHESTLSLSNRLSATLGLRYDWSRVDIDYDTKALMTCAASVMGQTANTRISSSLKHREHDNFDQLLPKLSFIYNVDDNNSNIYITASKGYRSGGFNIQMFSDILQSEIQAASSQRGDYEVSHNENAYDNIRNTISYKPETSWNYELGSHLNLFGNAMHVDAALFYMQVKNQQLSVMAGTYGFGRMMVNAGKSNSCGVELSVRGNVFDNHLSYSASYGFTHATFREYTDSIKENGKLTMVDYKGNKVPFVPEHTFAASVDWRFDVNHKWLSEVTIGANLWGQGRNYWDEQNTLSQKAFAVLGAHVSFKVSRATFNLWATNITDTRYNTFAVSSQATGTKHWFGQRAMPFRYGIDWNVKL